MDDWPRLISQKRVGRDAILLDVETDEDFVLHLVQKEEKLSNDEIQADGAVVRFGSATIESWVYLDDEAARKLHDSLGEFLALGESDGKS